MRISWLLYAFDYQWDKYGYRKNSTCYNLANGTTPGGQVINTVKHVLRDPPFSTLSIKRPLLVSPKGAIQ